MQKRIALVTVIAALLGACSESHQALMTMPQTDGNSSSATASESAAPTGETLAAGSATVFETTASAFEKHSANLTSAIGVRDFNIGNDFFKNPWVPNRSSTSLRDGLGPHFNNNACQDCHIRDGRGHAPNVSATEDGSDFSSMLIRAARSSISAAERDLMLAGELANVGDSSVGGQLQQHALAGVQIESALGVSYQDVTMTFADGHSITLREPSWHLTSLYKDSGYDFDSDTVFSARIAPPMIGLGLLMLIPAEHIIANEDINDANSDGISGKANRVWSLEDNAVTLGRFGWKAGQPSVLEQAAGAFLGDMGLTSRLHATENCLPHQADCLQAPTGNGDSNGQYDYEVSDQVLERVAFYSAHLGVPARRNADAPVVKQGKQLFKEAGCDSCHIEKWQTGESSALPELANQTIYPCTDMLLHDLGPELADFTIDNTPAGSDVLYEYQATATEWRTPPLWGIGLTHTVDPKATFLHDGRARTIMEAVLWHGGEASASRDKVLQFNSEERNALNAFLMSL